MCHFEQDKFFHDTKFVIQWYASHEIWSLKNKTKTACDCLSSQSTKKESFLSLSSRLVDGFVYQSQTLF